jgi:hypothetical protein
LRRIGGGRNRSVQRKAEGAAVGTPNRAAEADEASTMAQGEAKRMIKCIRHEIMAQFMPPVLGWPKRVFCALDAQFSRLRLLDASLSLAGG